MGIIVLCKAKVIPSRAGSKKSSCQSPGQHVPSHRPGCLDVRCTMQLAFQAWASGDGGSIGMGSSTGTGAGATSLLNGLKVPFTGRLSILTLRCRSLSCIQSKGCLCQLYCFHQVRQAGGIAHVHESSNGDAVVLKVDSRSPPSQRPGWRLAHRIIARGG